MENSTRTKRLRLHGTQIGHRRGQLACFSPELVKYNVCRSAVWIMNNILNRDTNLGL